MLLALGAAGGCGEERVALDRDAACAASECRVPVDYGELGGVGGAAEEIQQSLVWFGVIEDECGERVVELSIELVNGRGAFAGGLTTGTVALAGDELDPDSCGACVRLIVDDGKCYFATAGTLELTAIEIDLVGRLSGAGFGPLDCLTDQAIAGTCASLIGSMSFNETIGGEG
jgi:hypothetical protein